MSTHWFFHAWVRRLRRLPLLWFACVVAQTQALEFRFATAAEGRAQLTNVDEYVRRLSPFDRAARLKTDRPVSEHEYLQHVSAAVIEWSADETNKLGAALETLAPKLRSFPVSWPDPIWVVRTTGAEEGNAAYTRGGSIMLAPGELKRDPSPSGFEALLAHECFHILSRANPKLRDDLYQLIGFKPCPEVRLAPALERRRITNPDAPFNRHSIELTVNGRKSRWLPLLISSSEKYEPARGGEFFDYLQIRLAPAGLPAAVEKKQLIALEDAEGFMEQVGDNTDYLLHPEEILADNFMILLTNGHAKTPALTNRLDGILRGKKRTGEAGR